ncbi:4313_t:CDS:2 [Acaulospora morrowiae]|uniref:4313_t:CDS:1 n=1 Tax=Acaulospora morrowiae TaxID=94023 RepID=A0A9N9AX18_9GLOM|nr:4313_t:CDS:2 [Acaulospora morrowiae]
MKDTFSNANFPKTADGRVYHVGVKQGEVANRIITVGDPSRAQKLAEWLDKDFPIFQHSSSRGFFTLTGKYKGVLVSIIAIGMGLPMMDFFVREVRAITDGPLIIIRFGSCGTIGKGHVGEIVVPRGSFSITRNFDYFLDGGDEYGYESAENVKETESDLKPGRTNKRSNTGETNLPRKRLKKEERPYILSKVVNADSEIYEMLQRQLLLHLPPDEVHTGLNASCDSFYSSQNREDENFTDNNKGLIKSVIDEYPEAESLEMETFMLFHLAKCSTDVPLTRKTQAVVKNRMNKNECLNENSIRAAALMMVFADRKTNEFVDPSQVDHLESVVGQVVLDTLISVKSNEVCVKSEKLLSEE